jgi:[ribosomal protein S5]-alanine N-acetyltransferase
MIKKILLITPRVIIKTPVLNDFENLYDLQSNPEIMTFIGNGIRSAEEVAFGLSKAINHQKKHGFSLGCVFKKDNLKFIGRAGLIYKNYDDQQTEIEIAYALLPEYWRQGYATEIVLNLIQWAHESLQITAIVAVVNPDNFGSKKVLTKAGMTLSREEFYNDKPVEIWSYPLTRNKSYNTDF